MSKRGDHLNYKTQTSCDTDNSQNNLFTYISINFSGTDYWVENVKFSFFLRTIPWSLYG